MKKILCSDDSVNLLRVLKKRFELEIVDTVVMTADTGEKGIRIAREELPSVILLDITMPDMSGDEVLRELKSSQNEDVRSIPVIILTSHGPEKRSEYLQAGAVDYISSPFDIDELLAKIKKIFEVS